MKTQYALNVIFLLLILTLTLLIVIGKQVENDRKDKDISIEKKYRDSLYNELIEIKNQRHQIIHSIDSIQKELEISEYNISKRIQKLKIQNEITINSYDDSTNANIINRLLSN